MSNTSFAYADERFADLQMLRFRLAGFGDLSLRQKKYIYYLSKATLVGRDITTDQFGKFNILIRKTLEAVYTDTSVDRTTPDFLAMEVYLKRVWFSNGIHHHYGCEKFEPGFSEAWFRQTVALLADNVWKREGYGSAADLLAVVCPVIFDPSVQPKRVNQTAGEDLVATSACNFYEDVSQQEAETFYAQKQDPSAGDEQPSWGLNSKLVKRNGLLQEDVFREGGLYGVAISKIIFWLSKAAGVAENDQQRKVIGLLINYYKTGDLRLFDEYSIEWLKEQEGMVDFINGFIKSMAILWGSRAHGRDLSNTRTWKPPVAHRPSPLTPNGLRTTHPSTRASVNRR